MRITKRFRKFTLFSLLLRFFVINKKTLKGFALIEVSIALLVLGIISSISISQFAALKRTQAEMITRENINCVIRALAAYYISKRGSIPFPAHKQSKGRQIIPDYNSKAEFGVVPYKTLGIMEKYAKDGYGNWLQYKANPDFGKPTYSEYYSAYSRNLGINEFESDEPNDKVAFVIKYTTNGQEHYVWYSENNFAQIFAGGKVSKDVVVYNLRYRTAQ